MSTYLAEAQAFTRATLSCRHELVGGSYHLLSPSEDILAGVAGAPALAWLAMCRHCRAVVTATGPAWQGADR